MIKRFAIAIALAATIAQPALAQDYPSRPISLMVPFAAGSGTDAVARTVAQKLGERLGQTVVVENKPGASAQIGAEYVAKAKPDGYTLFMTTNTSHSANPSLFKTLRYDPLKDFTPIVRTGELPFALVVRPESPVKTVAELIAYVKANPGRVRAIGATPAHGSKLLPDVPPIASTVPDFDLTSWNGIFGPAGLPRPIVDRLNREVQAVLAEREDQENLAGIGFEVRPSESPEEFAKDVANQLALWKRLIEEAGIPKQ